MRILMTVSSTSLMDGIGRHILAMAPALNARDGVEVAVLTLWKKGELNAELEAKGIKTYSLDAPNGHCPSVIWRTCRVLHDFKPDIVHHHVMPLMVAVALKCFCHGLKIVLTRHGVPDPMRQQPLFACFLSRFRGLVSLRYSAVCYVSNGVMRALEGLPEAAGNTHKVVYNPIDFSRREIGTGETIQHLLGLPPDAPVIGTACRFAAAKNLPAFIEVAAHVLNANEKTHAVLLGTGDARIAEQIAGKINDLSSDVRSRMHLLGYRQDAHELVRSFSCFVMTSLREGMPTALLEAIVAKTPVAFFNGEGGLSDLNEMCSADEPWAIVAERGDFEALGDGIVQLLENREMACDYADRAWLACSKVFSLDQATDSLIDVYKRVLK